MRSQIHLEVRQQMVEYLCINPLNHHWLVDRAHYVQGYQQVVADLHVNLLLFHFKLTLLCLLLHVTLYYLAHFCQDEESLCYLLGLYD